MHLVAVLNSNLQPSLASECKRGTIAKTITGSVVIRVNDSEGSPRWMSLASGDFYAGEETAFPFAEGSEVKIIIRNASLA